MTLTQRDRLFARLDQLAKAAARAGGNPDYYRRLVRLNRFFRIMERLKVIPARKAA